MDTRNVGPAVLFAVGIIMIFISGGSKMFLVAGDAIVFLSGLAFMRLLR